MRDVRVKPRDGKIPVMLSWKLRCGAVGLALAAGPLAVACGSSEGNAGFSPSDGGVGNDSSTGTDSAATDSSFPDTGLAETSVDGPSPDAGARPTTALFVQGSPSIPDVRLCWGVGTARPLKVAPFPDQGAMPASNYPGIPLGGAASMSDATALAVSGLTLYALDAEVLARQAPKDTCDQLVCGQGTNLPPDCLRYNLDYWPVATLTAPIQREGSNVVALAGCLPSALDPAASTELCGPTWTALAGNLHADVVQLGQAHPLTGQIAVQAAQLSPSVAALVGDAGAVVSFGLQGAADAGVVAMLAGEGQLQPSAQTVSVGPDLASYGTLGFAVDVPGLDGGAGHLWMSLAQSQQLVDPTQDPSMFFGAPRPYVVAVLGDPNAPHAFNSSGGAYDGKGLHVLVLAAAAPPAAADQ